LKGLPFNVVLLFRFPDLSVPPRQCLGHVSAYASAGTMLPATDCIALTMVITLSWAKGRELREGFDAAYSG